MNKIAKYQLPKKEEDLDALANQTYTYAGPHLTGASPDWTDLPLEAWTAFRTALMDWNSAYAACKVPHLPAQTAGKNLAEKALRSAFSNLLERGLLLPPRTAQDAVAMGFHLIDDVPTHDTEIHDTVDIESITNGAVTGSHTHVIRYRIQGHPTRAKDPYQLAVFQVHYRAEGEAEPELNGGGWGPDILSANEPLEVRHEPEHAGKTAYYRARWQTYAAQQGNWAMASALVP